jgi:transcriptional regulator with XRE-family HTH domain
MPGYIIQRMLEGEGPIQVWRSQRAMTIDALAKRVGISAAALVELETEGQRADSDALADIATALNVPIAFLRASKSEGEARTSPDESGSKA